MKVGRWLFAVALLLPSVGFFSAKAATLYAHQALPGHWILPTLPEGGSLLLVGSAFLGLASLTRRRKASDSEGNEPV